MKSDNFDAKELMTAVAALQREVADLRERLASIEQRLPDATRNRTTQAVDTSRREQLSEELVLTISAAVAAYLGVKPHIRQIRLVRSEAWAQHGRVTVQASHDLSDNTVRSPP